MQPNLTGTAVVLDDGVKSLKAGDGEPVHPIFTVYPGALFGERCILGIDHNFTLTVSWLIFLFNTNYSYF
jgi:hypothetical protein